MATQDNRHIRIDTPLAPDTLLLESFDAEEVISQLFSIRARLLSENGDVAFGGIVGKPVTIRIEATAGPRFFHGIVKRFRHLGVAEQNLYRYEAEIVPWLWLGTQSTNCRIFENISVPDILAEVFGAYPEADFEDGLDDTYEPRIFCVQYRETDFQFVSRLMEEEGIQYFFEFENGAHRLVLADRPTRNLACPLQPTATLNELAPGSAPEEVVTSFSLEQQVTTERVVFRDYNFETPSETLQVDKGPDHVLERYDYPGEYEVEPAGQRYALIRHQEQKAFEQIGMGSSFCRGLTPGFRFELTGHPAQGLNGTFLLTAVRHSASEQYFQRAQPSAYYNSFECIPHHTPFRPTRQTPRPRISGTQTAVIVGPNNETSVKDEEIETDNHGRVKVHFHWDRRPEGEGGSCWIRVSQAWAGTNFGGVFLPRIGQEVIVEFLEGDPDRPIVTGRVYNAAHMPPLELPGEMTKSTVQSRSTKQGGRDNWNGVTFEDTKGSEEFYLQAEKNKRVLVKNDRSENVGHDETISIGNDRTETVGNNEKITIGVDRTDDVGSNETITIGANQKITVNANRSETVLANEDVTVAANRSHTINANDSLKVSSNQTRKVGVTSNEMVGAAKTSTVGGAYAITVAGAMNTAVGLVAMEVVGLIKKIIAGSSIELVCGSSSIKLESGGKVTIKGTEFLFDSGGPVQVKGAPIDLN